MVFFSVSSGPHLDWCRSQAKSVILNVVVDVWFSEETSVALSRALEEKWRLVFVVSKGGLTNEKPKIGSVVFLSHRQKVEKNMNAAKTKPHYGLWFICLICTMRGMLNLIQICNNLSFIIRSCLKMLRPSLWDSH